MLKELQFVPFSFQGRDLADLSQYETYEGDKVWGLGKITILFGSFLENLPPHLAQLDRNMPRKKLEPTKPAESVEELSEQFSDRINVFDGDEFDINSQVSNLI